ncbi:MAG: hypothetical protein ACOC1Z_04810 [Cyanobacteriota bacterium]
MTLSYPSKRTLESDADQVLDPLFTELEDTLEVENDGQSLVRGEQRLVSLHRNSLSSKGRVSHSWDDSPVSENPNFFDSDFPPFNEDNVTEEPFSSPPLWLKHLDKIIFTSSCSLLVWVLFLLQKEEQFLRLNLNQLRPSITLSETDTPESLDNSVEFINYMERALAQIDREQALKAKAQDLTPAVTPSVEIPPVSTKPSPEPKSEEQTPSSPPPETNQGGQETDISSLPALPPPPPSQSTPTETETPAAEDAQTDPPPTEDSSPLEVNPPTEETESPPPSRDQTLVGLLELGEHSAALLKVEGVTQRIMIGETVPDSNWTLAEISNNKARFENGGQEKSMYVGESLVNN